MVELNSCPFCGAKTEIERTLMVDGKTIRYIPNAHHKHGCQLEFAAFIGQPTTKRAAIKKWNRRVDNG